MNRAPNAVTSGITVFFILMAKSTAKQWSRNFSPAEITKPRKYSLKGRPVKEYNGVYANVAGDTAERRETRLPSYDFPARPNEKQEAERTTAEAATAARDGGSVRYKKNNDGNGGIVLKTFAEALLIFKLLAPLESAAKSGGREQKGNERKGGGGKGTF